jgi:DNA-binding GntR family transcriptional regulator
MSRIASLDGINRRYLHDEVADRLRQLILEGDLEPKSRVNELELSERFGISRTPLREAIKILATEGLLELLPNRGARVASIDETEIDEMLEVIAGLEANAAWLATARITPEEIRALMARHDAMLQAYASRDEVAYFRANREIHEGLMAAARNTTLSGLYANLSGRIQRFRYSAHKTDAQWKRAVDEHEEMIRLIQSRDGERLSRLMRTHILGKKEPIVQHYGTAGS